MIEPLPFTIKIPWYRRVLYSVVFVFMGFLGALPLAPGGGGESLGLYLASGFFAAVGIAGLVYILFFVPQSTLVVDEQGIFLSYLLDKKLQRKLLWDDIVRIERIGFGRQELLAIECKEDAEKASKEGFASSALRFTVGRLVPDGGRAGVYVTGMLLPSVKKTADRLNTIRIEKQNHG